MRCEVIAIGTELLLGQNVDTNSAWIGEQLALAGIDSYYHTRVGDNLARMVNALNIALDRNEAVIVCGGLGPTHDDITREALAEVMGAPLVRDDLLVERIRELFISRGREMPTNNLRQADVPEGASIIPQMPGTAPGLICPVGEKIIYAVPGVPYEMREMVAGTIIPDLQKRAGSVNVIKSRTLRTWGQSESGLAELLEPRIAELNKTDNPTLAFLASGIEGIKVRITAKAQDHATAQRILDEEDARLRAILGELVFGIDQQTMESVVIDQLRERNLTLAVTESITGGLMSARLTAAPYANEVLRGGIMLGSGEPQSYLLGMSALPADPETAARDMALIACRTFQADVGLAVAQATEANEPSARAANKIFLAIAIDGLAQSKLVHLPGRRESVRQFAVINLLNMLRLHLTADGSA
jgi:nicotinamide-nucleotide amidase